MSESKQRKKTDPNFGRVPKSANRRGLVVCPPIEIKGSHLFVKSSNLDPQELRFALLFWDRLVWPSSRMIHFSSNPDESYLESERVLTRPDYTFSGDQAQGIAKSQIKAFQDLELSEPGLWALSQGENSLLLREGVAEDGKGVLVELHRAIPIPKRDVPLAEILEFRQRRRDELILLRSGLDSLASEIDKFPDRELELRKRVDELDEACANLLRVAREWRFPVYLSNFSASFNVSSKKLLPAAGLGWKLGEPHGLAAATIAAATGGVMSTIEMKGDIKLRSIRGPESPYRYAYQIHEELR